MPINSSHWGAFRAEAHEGRITGVVPFEKDPHPSPLLAGMARWFDHPTRIRRPAIRKGWLDGGPTGTGRARGAEPFVEVPWDEALDLVARELSRVRDRFGNRAIFGGSYGWSSAGRFHHAKTQLKRFLNGFGGCVQQVNNYSFGAGMVLLPHVVGDIGLLYGRTTDWRSLIENTELLLAFGGLPARNAQVESGGVGAHSAAGFITDLTERCEIVNVSPARSDVAGADRVAWWPVVPGTDTAVMLAMMHVLLTEALYDADFVERHCVGFDRLADHLRTGRDGRPFDADWASGLSSIPAETIRATARQLRRRRSFIALGWSLQRSDYGEQTYWAAIALAAMAGHVGLPGGGVGFGYGSVNGTGNPVRRYRAPALPTGANPLDLAIPVARVTDLLMRPGESLAYDGGTIELPDVRLVYWAGGNPYHHHQDLNRLARAWQRPDTIVVHETHWTATARRADIVLPATTTLERDDIGASSGDRFLMAMKKVVEPFAEARDDHAIFRDLAARLGFEAAFTEGLSETEWLVRLYEETRRSARAAAIDLPDFAGFWRDDHVEVPEPEERYDAFADFRRDPVAHPLATPSGRIELHSEVIAGFGHADCPGHPCWRPPREWLGAPLANRYPLHLISTQPRHRLHGQLDVVGASRASKIAGREPVHVAPGDAEARGLRHGDVVRLFNDRGACLAGVVIDADLRPGVVRMATGAWFDPVHPGEPGSLDAHGNPNVLTHDLGTSSLSQGPAAESVLVEMEIFRAPLPPITIDKPPAFVPRG